MKVYCSFAAAKQDTGRCVDNQYVACTWAGDVWLLTDQSGMSNGVKLFMYVTESGRYNFSDADGNWKWRFDASGQLTSGEIEEIRRSAASYDNGDQHAD